MQSVLTHLSQNYPIYKQRIEETVLSSTSPYDSLLQPLNLSVSEPFFRQIIHVLTQFLNSQEDDRLFLQIPFQKIGRSIKQQNDNFDRLVQIVSDVLHVHTSQANIPDKVAPQKISLDDYYFLSQPVAPANGTARCRFWKVVQSSSNDFPLRLEEQGPDSQHFKSSEVRELMKNYDSSFVRLNSCPNSFRASVSSRFAAYSETLALYEKVRTANECTQYANALLVSCGVKRFFRPSPIADLYYPDKVYYTTNFFNLANRDREILVFVGHNKYKYVIDDIQFLLGTGRVRKVVFIGTDIDDSLPIKEASGSVGWRKYSFSFRELFNYFHHIDFPNIVSHVVSNQWLVEAVSRLRTTIGEKFDGLAEKEKQDLLTISCFPMLEMGFRRISSSNVETVGKYVYENFPDVIDINKLDEYLEYYSEISVDYNTCPKVGKLQQIKNGFRAAAIYQIKNHYTFKADLKKFVKDQTNINTNQYVIDAKGDWRGFSSVLSYLFEQGIVGSYNFISYCELTNIRRYLLQELDCYNGTYRTALLNAQFPALNEAADDTPKSLADFFSDAMLDDIMHRQWSQSLNEEHYQVIDESNDCYNVSGNVIYYNRQIPVSELYDEQAGYLPATMLIYQTPADINKIVAHKLGVTNGSVEECAQLWKKVLRDRCASIYDGKAEKMRSEEYPFLPKSQIKNYMKESCTTLFPDTLRLLASTLKRQHLITDDEYKNMIGAYKCTQKNAIVGGLLKDALFLYITKHEENNFLHELLHKNGPAGPFTIEELLRQSIIERQIISIKKTKNLQK